MDEGWANLLPFFYFEEHSPEVDYFGSRVDRYHSVAGQEVEVALMTLGDILTVRDPYRQASYNKPFFAYYQLYEYLGEELFTSTLQHYVKAWAGKHPMPYDFFNAFNVASGENLNGYWQNWFFDRNHADLALAGMDGDEVLIENVGGLFVPVELDILYENDTNVRIHEDLGIWKKDKRIIRIALENPETIKSIRLGNERIPDVDRSDNTLTF
jgi:hypothetical protein